MAWNTPLELSLRIHLQFADVAGGEDSFRDALDKANAEILFRLGEFDATSYPERSPFDALKFSAAQTISQLAEWHRAGAILYKLKAETETKDGEAGNILSTPDGVGLGAFTPNRLEVQAAYLSQAKLLNNEYERLLSVILPKSNFAVGSMRGGRSDFTDNGKFWGSDDEWS